MSERGYPARLGKSGGEALSGPSMFFKRKFSFRPPGLVTSDPSHRPLRCPQSFGGSLSWPIPVFSCSTRLKTRILDQTLKIRVCGHLGHACARMARAYAHT